MATPQHTPEATTSERHPYGQPKVAPVGLVLMLAGTTVAARSVRPRGRADCLRMYRTGRKPADTARVDSMRLFRTRRAWHSADGATLPCADVRPRLATGDR